MPRSQTPYSQRLGKGVWSKASGIGKGREVWFPKAGQTKHRWVSLGRITILVTLPNCRNPPLSQFSILYSPSLHITQAGWEVPWQEPNFQGQTDLACVTSGLEVITSLSLSFLTCMMGIITVVTLWMFRKAVSTATITRNSVTKASGHPWTESSLPRRKQVPKCWGHDICLHGSQSC